MAPATAAPPPDPSLGVICDNFDWSEAFGTGLIHCLTRGQSIGLSFTTEAAFLSLLAVVLLFSYIIRNMIIRGLHCKKGERVIKGPADVYMLSLLCADLIQAVGTVMDIRWVQEGKVEVGHFCTAQGIVQQMGETPVAMNTLAFAVHTFLAIWLGDRRSSLTVSLSVVGFIWIFVFVFVSVTALARANYEMPTPYWCWIGPSHTPDRIAGEYIWLWSALAVSFALYIPLFLFKRGNIKILDAATPWKVTIQRRGCGDPEESANDDSFEGKRDHAFDMLAYPLTYSIIVLPWSIVRWITFRDSRADVPSATVFFCITVYGLSGFANVLLLTFTRPGLLTFGPKDDSDEATVNTDAITLHLPGRPLPSVESLQ